MSTATKIRQSDQLIDVDTSGNVRTYTTTGTPSFIRELHVSTTENMADYCDITGDDAFAIFWIEPEDFPYIDTFGTVPAASVENITLVYKRRVA